jgi:hypothetical protein
VKMPALMIHYLLNVICKSQLKPVPESWLGAQGHGEGSVLRVRQLCSNLWSLLVLGIPQELRDSALTAAWHKVSIWQRFRPRRRNVLEAMQGIDVVGPGTFRERLAAYAMTGVDILIVLYTGVLATLQFSYASLLALVALQSLSTMEASRDKL